MPSDPTNAELDAMAILRCRELDVNGASWLDDCCCDYGMETPLI